MKNFYEKITGHRILNKKYWPRIFADYMSREIIWLKQNIPKNSVIVDMGCGEGRHLKLLARTIKEGVGIDNSKTMYQKSKKNLSKYKNIKVFYEDATKTHFKSNYFDITLCMNNTFGNLYEKQMKALKEMKRITKRNGKIVISVHSSTSKAVQTKFKLYKNVGLTGMKKDKDYVYTNEGFKSQMFSKSKLKSYFIKTNLNAQIITLNPMSYIVIATK